MRVQFANIQGVPTRYYSAGSGPPLLLLHGVGMSADSWLPTLEGLSDRFEVFAPDLLACGLTGDGFSEALSPQAGMAAHACALMEHLGRGPFGLIGSSLGALVAALVHLRRPDLTAGLVFSSGAPLLGPFDDRLRAGLMATWQNGRSAYEDTSLAATTARMGQILQNTAAAPRELLLLQMTLNALPGAAATFERRMAALHAAPDGDQNTVGHCLEQIGAPTLLIYGQQDIRGGDASDRTRLTRIPSHRSIGYDACGHFPHLEHPERFNADAGDFLATVARPAPVPA